MAALQRHTQAWQSYYSSLGGFHRFRVDKDVSRNYVTFMKIVSFSCLLLQGRPQQVSPNSRFSNCLTQSGLKPATSGLQTVVLNHRATATTRCVYEDIFRNDKYKHGFEKQFFHEDDLSPVGRPHTDQCHTQVKPHRCRCTAHRCTSA